LKHRVSFVNRALVVLAVELAAFVGFSHTIGGSTDVSLSAIELRPGVYVAREATALPLAASGYDLYVVGETHGANETVSFFLHYLERLHRTVALRDVALEASPVFERGIDEFVAGLETTLPDLWYWELAGADKVALVRGIRAMNEALPEEERVRVHLIDLDFGYELIHRHVLAVREDLGEIADSIDIPSLSGFEQLSEDEMLSLVDRLGTLAGDEGYVLDELRGLRASVRFRFVRAQVDRWEAASNECTAIRDEAIAENLRRLLQCSTDAPVLVLFGGAHVQKARIIPGVAVRSQTVAIEEPYWAERLNEEGTALYSLLTGGLSGSVASHGAIIRVSVNPSELHFPDGVTLGDLLVGLSDYRFVYVDLRNSGNALATLGEGFSPQTARFDPEKSAGEAFDGILLFERLTPAR